MGHQHANRLQNVSLDIGGSGLGSADPNLQMSLPLIRSVDASSEGYYSQSYVQYDDDSDTMYSEVNVYFNGTIPLYNGVAVRMAQERLANVTYNASNCSAVTDVVCPPDSVVNCTMCPFTQTSKYYPCYRANPLVLSDGRCLPPFGTATRFVPGESLPVYLRMDMGLDVDQFTFDASQTVEWVLDPDLEMSFYDPSTVISGTHAHSHRSVGCARDAPLFLSVSVQSSADPPLLRSVEPQTRPLQ